MAGGANQRAGLAPVVRPGARTLILGSMPGNVSLELGQYYGHPRNLFWPIMAELLGIGGAYEERLLGLQREGIALWDVLDRCERPGSLDSAIRDEVPNDFASFLDAHRSIEAIVFNGRKAAGLWTKNVARFQALRPVARIAALPSTSPAHAAMPRADKVAAWRAALRG